MLTELTSNHGHKATDDPLVGISDILHSAWILAK